MTVLCTIGKDDPVPRPTPLPQRQAECGEGEGLLGVGIRKSGCPPNELQMVGGARKLAVVCAGWEESGNSS